MFNANEGYSLSDIAAVTNNDRDGLFNGGNSWWIILFILVLFGGNGYGGYGGFNGRYYCGGYPDFGMANGIAENYVLNTDFASIERKLDGVVNGLSDGFYAMNTGMLNGFNNQNIVSLQNTNAIQSSIANLGTNMGNCCCELKRGQDAINYNLATQVTAIMQNCNNNYRALHDEIVANRLEDKDCVIRDQQAQICALQLAASQAAQNAYLIEKLTPAPATT